MTGSERRRSAGCLRRTIVRVVVVLLCLVPGRASAREETAELRVKGLGWIQNREQRQTLKLLLGDQKGATIDANAIEDAALILYADLRERGYLEPQITAKVTRADGTTEDHPIDAKLEHPLPRPLTAKDVTLQVDEGRRYVLKQVTFEGLTALKEADARAFFMGESTLLPIASESAYSPARLSRSVGNLLETLRRRGYADARADAGEPQLDRATGDVRVAIKVNEGPAWIVERVDFAVAGDQAGAPRLEDDRVGRPWSGLWQQDFATLVRRWYYERGYPDVQVRLTPQAAPARDGRRAVTVLARVRPGKLVHVGRIRFEGNARTREVVMRPLVKAKTGDLLDPVTFDNGQSRLSRLGVFSSVDLRYEPPKGDTRDIVYELREGRRQDVSLLAGYGSYEQFRGGVEWRHYNLFGLAHSDRLTLVQSVKSTRGEYDYTVPELFGSTVDGTAKVFQLRREELSFVRQEYGANVSFLWPVPWLGANLTTGYTFRRLRNMNNDLATSGTDSRQNNAASLEVGLVRDRRDNPLTPRRGYRLSLQVEEASRWLGGQVDYQQLQASASWHKRVGQGQWVHVGFTHGVVATMGAQSDTDLPVNVRFFPGGDNSIRGYQEGEAAPRTTSGQFVGAKTFTLLNVEFEQALTTKWSAVVFSDSLGEAARLADYPFDERLYSIGIGLRYQTIIGPVRLEYGRNLNPRPLDPSGTVQVSIGFPF